MIDLFADTSGWASWASKTQLHHTAAVDAIRGVTAAGRKVVTTTYVLAELTALLGRLRMTRERQIELLRTIETDRDVVVVPVEPLFYEPAWNLWRSRPDKEWTLVDCASFVVMQARRLTDALTTDHHFEQAGFVRRL